MVKSAVSGNGKVAVNRVKEAAVSASSKTVSIPAPKMQTAKFSIVGNAPLVIHRFSVKTKNEMLHKMEAGSTGKSKKVREALDKEQKFNDARYISPEGWDGFNAASIRAAMISACRLVNFKMTLAKMSVFVIQDGWDKDEPEIPLIKIHGEARLLESMARVETGQPYVTIRPCYDKWSAEITIRFDTEQFTIQDVANLLSRVGAQVGIGEGRPDSKHSAGMGWGTFDVKGHS
jgi:hypothetical protein